MAMSALLAAAACGRIGFDPDHPDGGAFVDVASPLDVAVSLDAAAADSADASPADALTALGTVLCDDFEMPALNYDPCWLVEMNALVEDDLTLARTGSRSMHVHVNDLLAPQVGQGEVTETALVPVPVFFMRAFVYLPALPGSWLRLAGLLEAAAPNEGPSLWIFSSGLTVTDTAGGQYSAGTSLPLARWACLEWQVTVGSPGELHVWVDGAELISVVAPTDLAPGLGRLSIGAAFFGIPSAVPAFDIWWDNVVVDSQRIGCTPFP
jgi:hypothetical protein